MATSSIFQSPTYETEEEIAALADALEASKARAHTIPKPEYTLHRPQGEELRDLIERFLEAQGITHD